MMTFVGLGIVVLATTLIVTAWNYVCPPPVSWKEE